MESGADSICVYRSAGWGYYRGQDPPIPEPPTHHQIINIGTHPLPLDATSKTPLPMHAIKNMKTLMDLSDEVHAY